MGNTPETAFRVGYAGQYPNQKEYSLSVVLDDAVKAGVVAGSPFTGRIILDVKTDTIEIVAAFTIKIIGKHSEYNPAVEWGSGENKYSTPAHYFENIFFNTMSEVNTDQRSFARGTYSIPFSTAVPYGSPLSMAKNGLASIRGPQSATRYFLEVLTIANSPKKPNIGVSGVFEFPVRTQIFSLVADPLQFGPKYCPVPRKTNFLRCTTTGPVENMFFGVHVPGIITTFGVPFRVSFVIVNNSRFVVNKVEISIGGKPPAASAILQKEQLAAMGMGPNILPFAAGAPNPQQSPPGGLGGGKISPEREAEALNDLKSMKYAVELTVPYNPSICPGWNENYMIRVTVVTNGPKIMNEYLFVPIQIPPVYMQLPPQGIEPKNIKDTLHKVTNDLYKYY